MAKQTDTSILGRFPKAFLMMRCIPELSVKNDVVVWKDKTPNSFLLIIIIKGAYTCKNCSSDTIERLIKKQLKNTLQIATNPADFCRPKNKSTIY